MIHTDGAPTIAWDPRTAAPQRVGAHRPDPRERVRRIERARVIAAAESILADRRGGAR